VISLFDLSLCEDKSELYVMMDLMDCDLHRIIQSKQTLTDLHLKTFALQLLEGIKAMHHCGVFHRDLKPGNLLVSKDCQLRITDFGLARFMDERTLSGSNSSNPMTEYVVTRWYRCPELLLAPSRPYSEAIDMWSIGCIIAELYRRKPLFPGKSHANQVQLIFEVKGYKSGDNLGFPLSSEASAFLERRCRFPAQQLSRVIPQLSPEAVELLEALLAMDPGLRPSAQTALASRYLAGVAPLADYSKIHLERPSPEYFDFELEKHSLQSLKALIAEEVASSGTGLALAPSVSEQARSSLHRESPSDVPTTPSTADEGPMSQMKTQKAATAETNPYGDKRGYLRRER
jgi:serine/threonine protein kinase